MAHRWAGLTITLFLVVVGFTGALLPWNEELTLLGRPSLAKVAAPRPGAPTLDGITLAERVEAATGAKVGYVNFDVPRDHVATVYVTAKDERPLGYDTVWVDPYSAAIRLTYRNGDLRSGPQAIMSFLYRLHYELALGQVGRMALGVAALIWTIDCFVGFYLTLPIRRRATGERAIVARPSAAPGWWSRWRPAWLIRRRAGAYKLTFDLHRAGGLWVWPLLFVFAWSGVGFTLPEVSVPVMRTLGATDDVRPPTAAKPIPNPPLGLRQARARGDLLLREIGRRDGFTVGDASGLSYDPTLAAYRYNARSGLDVVSRGGRTTVYFSAIDGRFLKFDPPVARNPANAFTTWLNLLHLAQVMGLPYRVFVSGMGVLVVMLSVTGVLIWMKKRSARLIKGRPSTAAARKGGPRAQPAG